MYMTENLLRCHETGCLAHYGRGKRSPYAKGSDFSPVADAANGGDWLADRDGAATP
jgi:hypothetical protein